MSVNSITNSVSRPTILEYANVLVSIDQIIAEYSKADAQLVKANKSRTLVSLIFLLHDMQTTGLAANPVLNTLAQAVVARAQSLTNLVNTGASASALASAMDNFVYTDLANSVKTNVASQALDPTNWVDGEGKPIHIQEAISDYCFFEVYRHADATMASEMGQLANRLQVSKQFLNALNSIYAGATWNPGPDYINTKGELQDYVDGEGVYHSWYGKFLEDGIPDTVINGMTNLQTMFYSNLFPTNSIEYSIANDIISIFYKTYDEGGFSAVATADAAARMWADRKFKLTIQNGIDSTSRLNEQLQLNLSRLLTNYDFFVRTSANFAIRDSEMLRNIANHVKDM